MENYYQNVQGDDQKVLSVKERIQNLNKENTTKVPSNAQSSNNHGKNIDLNQSNFSNKHNGYQNVNLVNTYGNNTSLNDSSISNNHNGYQNKNPVKNYQHNTSSNSTNFSYKNETKSPASDGEFLFNSYTYVDLAGKSEQEKVDSLKKSRAQNTVVKFNRNRNSHENSQSNNFHKFENMQEVHFLLERKYWWKNCKFVFVFIVLVLSILIITIILLVSH